MKVHRYELRLAGSAHTLLALRASDPARFSTNYFHNTWHVLSDPDGANVFHDICWLMAYQRKRGTLFVIDQRHLRPNPFDADPANLIVVVNSDLATPKRKHLAALKRHLPLRRQPDGTVKDSNTELRRASEQRIDDQLSEGPTDADRNRQRQVPFIERVNGVIVIAATPEVLAVWAYRIHPRMRDGMDYWELNGHFGPWDDGELQVFEDFDGMVGRALDRRQEFLPDTQHRAMTDEERIAYHQWMQERHPESNWLR